MMNQYVTGTVIKELREKNQLTQLQLAEKLGVSDKCISKWERFRRNAESWKRWRINCLGSVQFMAGMTQESSTFRIGDLLIICTWIEKEQIRYGIRINIPR